MEVKNLPKNNPIEYSGKVLDQRNNLTGPDDSGKTGYPKAPKHVVIQQSNRKEWKIMDGKYNTNDDATVELKKALSKTSPRKNPNMSEAEYKMKFQGKKS